MCRRCTSSVVVDSPPRLSLLFRRSGSSSGRGCLAPLLVSLPLPEEREDDGGGGLDGEAVAGARGVQAAGVVEPVVVLEPDLVVVDEGVVRVVGDAADVGGGQVGVVQVERTQLEDRHPARALHGREGDNVGPRLVVASEAEPFVGEVDQVGDVAAREFVVGRAVPVGRRRGLRAHAVLKGSRRSLHRSGFAPRVGETSGRAPVRRFDVGDV
mmetsp:Transcript_13768/g.41638  ORF Transcript_13768/g.41638 Transcript_13768/m.41638 type:complete len:212 (+) Transcript_13768:40-675(+)